MTRYLTCGCRAALVLSLGFAAVLSRAQNALYVKGDDDSWSLVQDARNSMPVIVEDGKLKAMPGGALELRKADEYAPAVCSVRRVEAEGEHPFDGNVYKLNEAFDFQGVLESGFALDHVFVVFDMKSEQDHESELFVQEVGSVSPNRPVPISAKIPIHSHRGGGHMELHVFSGGIELMNSAMAQDERSRVLDQMISRRIGNVQDSQPKPFMCASPVYPAKLSATKADGIARVRIRIGPKGDVVDSQVVSASDPAFGESAQAVLRAARFLPKVRAGQPVEAEVEIPFRFRYVPPAP